MVASRSDSRRGEDDIFTCLNCDFVLRLTPPSTSENSAPATK